MRAGASPPSCNRCQCRLFPVERCQSVLRLSQVQGVCVAAVQADAVPGLVSGREGGDAAPPGGQEGPSRVLELHGGQTWDSFRMCR